MSAIAATVAAWRDVDANVEAARVARLAREALVDALVGDIAGGLAVLRYDRVGSPAVAGLTDEHCWERARNIAAGLLANYRIEALMIEDRARRGAA